MLLGILALWIATLGAVAAMVGYTRACLRERNAARGRTHAEAPNGAGGRKNGKQSAPLADSPLAPHPSAHDLTSPRRWFTLSALAVAVVTVVLMTMVLGRHYELAYVWGHSGNDLPLHFRFASFWAGQEGTFVLWALYGSILGLLLIRKTREYERWVMPFFCAIQLFLLGILCVMSPFRLHDLGEIARQMALPEGFHVPETSWEKTLYFLGLAPALRPADGMGLNIALQNFWMVIHPPIIFIGFACLAVPGCFAFAALARRDYDHWVARAASWTIFGWMAIGFGKFLGGYWAYETLGWGGYWAWDPVENTSLVPWIFGTALIHGMLVQQARGSLKHANLFLGILTFLTVLYGTFLTRSGALTEFSVHSFTSPAFAVYVMMLGFMGLWGLGGLALFAARFAEIRSESAYDRLNERPFGFFLGVILLIGAGTVVCVGMSWPLISPLLVGKAASLKFDFYNRAMLPIATFICLLLSITPFMPWRKSGDRPAKPAQKTITIAAAVILALGIPAGALAWHGGSFAIQSWLVQAFRIPESLLQPDTGFSPAAIPALTVFFLAACLGIVANLLMIARTARGGILQTGAWVTHLALCIAFIGVVVSSVFSSGRELVLAKGESGTAHGYQVLYKGIVEPAPPAKRYLSFDVTRGKEKFEARLPYFEHGMGGRTENVARPVIYKYPDHDLYLAAGGWTDGRAEAEVAQGQSVNAMAYQISLKGFRHEGVPSKAGAGTEPIQIRPILDVTTAGVTETVAPAYTIYPDGRVEQERVALPGKAHELVVSRILVPGQEGVGDSPAVKFALAPLQPVDLVKIEISTKPGINLVWLGGYLMLFGAFLAYRRRATVARKLSGIRRPPSAGQAVPLGGPEPREVEPVLPR
jgi:cytochrome c-type biogenesis protein CcmF